MHRITPAASPSALRPPHPPDSTSRMPREERSRAAHTSHTLHQQSGAGGRFYSRRRGHARQHRAYFLRHQLWLQKTPPGWKSNYRPTLLTNQRVTRAVLQPQTPRLVHMVPSVTLNVDHCIAIAHHKITLVAAYRNLRLGR